MPVKRPDAPAKRTPKGKTEQGTGSGEYKVKGKRATAKQRETIDGVLGQAKEDNASRRVMIAAVMCITQESGAGELANVMTGNDDVGIYQQGRNWISVEGSKDPEQSTHAFLITGPTSWKKVHGGVKKAPGNLSEAIHRVQGNRDPQAYASWENEATETVDSWLDSGGSEGGGSYTKQYTFTRGEKGGSREDSWQASARLVEEVGAYRWAAANVFYAVSGDELRQQRPSLTIDGDEGWLLKQPSWSWATNRVISEVTMQVLADRWEILPGGCVMLPRDYGAMQGKWLVWNVSGPSLVSPEATVVLRRPTRLKAEPPSEKADRANEEGGDGEAGSAYEAAKTISDQHRSYSQATTRDIKTIKKNTSLPLDCSNSTALMLHMAGLYSPKVGHVSGWFAENWGSKGKGDEFTVWAHGGHVWTEFYDEDGSFKARFDTGGHPGQSGPRLVTSPRNDQGRFTPRSAKGH